MATPASTVLPAPTTTRRLPIADLIHPATPRLAVTASLQYAEEAAFVFGSRWEYNKILILTPYLALFIV
jgi:hypothetical protein